MGLTLGEYLALCLAALLVGISKAGFGGGGMGLLVGPALALLFPAKESVGLMLPILFLCDALALYPYWGKWDVGNVFVLTPGALIGIVLGTLALDQISDFWLAKAIGIMALSFAVVQIIRDRLLRHRAAFAPRLWHGSIAGFGTGFVSTLSHVGGILTTMYLIPQRMNNERFVGTTTAVYFLVNLFKIPAYLKLGMLNLEVLKRDLLVFPVAFVGTLLGVALNRRISNAAFSRIVLVIVLITGIALLLKG